MKDDSDDTAASPPSKDEKEQQGPMISASEVFKFGNTTKVKTYRVLGVLCSLVTGLVYPFMAFYFAKVFEDLGASTSTDSYLDNVREMAFTFVVLGAVGFVFLTAQCFFLELSSTEAAFDLKVQWFSALLRQDMAYFDIKDISSQATVVSANALRYKKGLGRKFGEGIQFLTTVIGGTAYAFWASWRVSLVILAVVPVMAGSASFVLTVTTKQTEWKNKNYKETGGIVYSTLSAIRTVFSLNASEAMIAKFQNATEKAFDSAKSFLVWVGLGNGAIMASFLLSYIALTLYGSYLLYDDVRKTGCDPSNTVGMGTSCGLTGTDVFGALMGISFGAMGLAQISAAAEAFMGARASAYPAVQAIERKLGSDEEEDIESSVAPTTEKREDIPLPKYQIDSSSSTGKELTSVEGNIDFLNVSFSYPSRPDSTVFDGFSLKIESGQTVALVGPSGSGKSTVVSLLERFYDPTAGSILIDGHDLRDLNVKSLREQIGLVSQEPVLFARSIKENIAYGYPDATDDQIIEAAKAANAHDFISKFPDGYETNVGDKGAQLSGGQKQRVAIARVLLKSPKILLLDEATSALDTESESVVQQALDDLVGSRNRTTIIIAHRLSTIRNADVIAVVKGGRIVEQGNHDTLINTSGSEYGKLVEAQTPQTSSSSSQGGSILSNFIGSSPEKIDMPQVEFRDVHFHYPTRPDNEVFKGLNLSIKHGETLAIVGPSGGGKSTVIQMLERFYDPTAGSIFLDGIDLRELSLIWLRNELGLVSQEPTLFNTTIGENIKYGYPLATQEEVEEAAKLANAHDFIMSFPNGYDTDVGENATQVSGGQKQRIAIARAIIKKPKILLLDEATSALDSESERVVQEAIDNVMASQSQTVIVIAHRLSTIKNADRIAVVSGGIVSEVGSHDYLMSLNGQYRRLQDAGSNSVVLKTANKKVDDEDDDTDIQSQATEDVEKLAEIQKVYSSRARLLAKNDAGLFIVGGIGAILTGLVFPGWGIAFAYMIELLFKPVFPCDDGVEGFDSCEDYWNYEADELKKLSVNVTWGWLAIIGATMVGNMLLFYGFGTATERMNKRVRDDVFVALMKQDVSYYDAHKIGNISTQIEDDAAMIHSFSGEPIRSLVMSVSSVVVGLVISFVYMWPFALFTLGILPFMTFGAMMEMKMYLGEDEGAEVIAKEDENSPGAIVVETLLNIRTVASLTIEDMRAKEYIHALKLDDPTLAKTNLLKGLATGVGFLIQTWGMGLMFWWGAWVISRWPNQFDYRGYLISMFSLLFSLSGMSVAFMGATDQTKAKAAAQRIFSLIDRESNINSLSDEGKKGK